MAHSWRWIIDRLKALRMIANGARTTSVYNSTSTPKPRLSASLTM